MSPFEKSHSGQSSLDTLWRDSIEDDSGSADDRGLLDTGPTPPQDSESFLRRHKLAIILHTILFASYTLTYGVLLDSIKNMRSIRGLPYCQYLAVFKYGDESDRTVKRLQTKQFSGPLVHGQLAMVLTTHLWGNHDLHWRKLGMDYSKVFITRPTLPFHH